MNELLNEIGKTYLQFAPYLMLGLVFNGILHLFFRRDFIVRHLGDSSMSSVVKASALGVPLPLCSCGVIPTGLYLRKTGASRGAVLSFLISTPQTGVDSILPTWGMLGPLFAIFRPVVAMIMGILGGVLGNRFLKAEKQDKGAVGREVCSVCNMPMDQHRGWLHRIRCAGVYAFRDFLDDISVQLVVGIILAGLIAWLIPDGFFEKYVGDGIWGMLVIIPVAIPLYVCATASIPIAAMLMLKGLSPGAAFVFLVAGPATNIATITMIAHSMGRKTVIFYLGIIIVFAILFGLLLNGIADMTGGIDLAAMHHHMGETSWWLMSVVGIFTILLLISIFRKLQQQLRRWLARGKKIEVMEMETLYRIPGMTCNHCVANIRKSLETLDGVEEVDVKLDSRTALVKGEVPREKVEKTLREAGYEVEK